MSDSKTSSTRSGRTYRKSKIEEQWKLEANPGSWYQIKNGRQKKKIKPCLWGLVSKHKCLVNSMPLRTFYLTGLCYICGKELSVCIRRVKFIYTYIFI